MNSSRKPSAKNLAPGAVFSMATPHGTAYVQWTHRGILTKLDTIRVLPGLYQDEPHLDSLLARKEIYWCMFFVPPSVRDGDFVYVGTYALPVEAGSPMRFLSRAGMRDGKTAVSPSARGTYFVYLDSNADELTLTREEVEALPFFEIPNRIGLLFRILELNGYPTPQLAADSSEQEGVLHFLYVTRKSVAENLARRILSRYTDVNVVVDKAAAVKDGRRWSVKVFDSRQPYDPERLSTALQQLAEEAGEEYDGFEVPSS